MMDRPYTRSPSKYELQQSANSQELPRGGYRPSSEGALYTGPESRYDASARKASAHSNDESFADDIAMLPNILVKQDVDVRSDAPFPTVQYDSRTSNDFTHA